MLYAVSEIVFFLLLATLLGIGLGWWMARSDRVSVVAAMDRSGAHAASDRELVEAMGRSGVLPELFLADGEGTEIEGLGAGIIGHDRVEGRQPVKAGSNGSVILAELLLANGESAEEELLSSRVFLLGHVERRQIFEVQGDVGVVAELLLADGEGAEIE